MEMLTVLLSQRRERRHQRLYVSLSASAHFLHVANVCNSKSTWRSWQRVWSDSARTTSCTSSSWYTTTKRKKHTPRTMSRVSFSAMPSICSSTNTRCRRRGPRRPLHPPRSAHQDALGLCQPESQHFRILNASTIYLVSAFALIHSGRKRPSQSGSSLPGPNIRVKTLYAAWTRWSKP